MLTYLGLTLWHENKWHIQLFFSEPPFQELSGKAEEENVFILSSLQLHKIEKSIIPILYMKNNDAYRQQNKTDKQWPTKSWPKQNKNKYSIRLAM